MPFSRSTFYTEIQQIVNEVEAYVRNSFVQQFVQYPAINWLQLQFTYAFLQSKGLSYEEAKRICIPQLLIQLGLNTHDQVTDHQDDDQQHERTQQLTVLSGDYFSSYYYLYLAQRNEIEDIRKWAKVIKRINEHKVDMQLRSVQMVERRVIVTKQLTNAILEWFEADEYWHQTYDQLIELYMYKDRWDQERAEFERKLTLVISLIRRSGQEVLKSECQGWVDYLQKEHLVTEP